MFYDLRKQNLHLLEFLNHSGLGEALARAWANSPIAATAWPSENLQRPCTGGILEGQEGAFGVQREEEEMWGKWMMRPSTVSGKPPRKTGASRGMLSKSQLAETGWEDGATGILKQTKISVVVSLRVERRSWYCSESCGLSSRGRQVMLWEAELLALSVAHTPGSIQQVWSL